MKYCPLDPQEMSLSQKLDTIAHFFHQNGAQYKQQGGFDIALNGKYLSDANRETFKTTPNNKTYSPDETYDSFLRAADFVLWDISSFISITDTQNE